MSAGKVTVTVCLLLKNILDKGYTLLFDDPGSGDMSSSQDKYLLELHLVLQHRAELLVHANPISDSGRHCKRKIMHPCYPPALMRTYKTVELHFFKYIFI